uniref:CUB domain-containing protein n=1 Tax=Panagrolaimus davidi TaxID=227884 RepID=A0A914QES4_9BILA
MSRNDPYGYPNNALCEYELEIPSNTIIVARDDGPQNQEYEYGVDFLGFYDEDTDSFLPLKSKYGITYETTQLLKPYPNGTAKKMRWKFESDGSGVPRKTLDFF